MTLLPHRMVSAIVVVLLGLTVGATPTVAAPAPPANDRLADATRLSVEPHTVRQDTTLATFNAATDRDCVFGASVWFRMRVDRERTVRLSTIGSDYDTVLAVFAGPRPGLTNIGCNDDAVVLTSAVEVKLTPGRNYFVAVSACCSETAPGGSMVLNVVRKRLLTTSTTLRTTTAGDVSGRAFVSGVQACSNPSALQVTATLSQRVDRFVARGTSSMIFPFCHLRARPYVVAIDSETTIAFRQGRAFLTLDTTASDGFQFAQTPQITRVVTLTLDSGAKPLVGRAAPKGSAALGPGKP